MMFQKRRLQYASLAVAMTFSGAAVADDFALLETLHPSHVEHVDQTDIDNGTHDFMTVFDMGDELFEVEFLAHDGGGINVGNGERHTRVPRADLFPWNANYPARATGPNGQSCVECHSKPVADGAGGIGFNVHRDPHGIGHASGFIQRNTPHLHGMGIVQRAAEEMTDELWALRDELYDMAMTYGGTRSIVLEAKGVNFGILRAKKKGSKVKFNYRRVKGVDKDLVVKPFQWKGNFRTVRDFNTDAFHNELGVQPVETTGMYVDGDHDGVVNEATVGDVTAMTIYLAAQPRPTTKTELEANGFIPGGSAGDPAEIAMGEYYFGKIGCGTCHTPEMTIDEPVFQEPSAHPAYQSPFEYGVPRPVTPVSFSLIDGQPDNAPIGGIDDNGDGTGTARMFGDLKRHYMGQGLAEQIDETGHGPAVFKTKNLWGVGVTAPYLHDGRATTLTEAILWHGGEARRAKRKFERLSDTKKAAIIAFLDDMVIFLPDEE